VNGDALTAARVHLAACLALVRPVSMSDAAAAEWVEVAAREVAGYAPSVIEQACAVARKHCGHHGKIVPKVVEECERLEVEFRRHREQASAPPLLAKAPAPRPAPQPWEIEDNERWLNTPGETQAKLRTLGLANGALIDDGVARVRYAPDLR